jgi:C2 domain
MDSDKVARTLDELAPALPPKGTPKERFLFTVKIVHAENLPSTDSSSRLDTFVTLSDEKGVRLAKTRTIYESLTPRCMSATQRVFSLR